jgi:vacuolar-type H+-ATPase subunit I/STV1
MLVKSLLADVRKTENRKVIINSLHWFIWLFSLVLWLLVYKWPEN